MKTIRILRWINAGFWSCTLLAIVCIVTAQWNEQGCDADSLKMAVAFYAAGSITIGFVIDQHLKEQIDR